MKGKCDHIIGYDFGYDEEDSSFIKYSDIKWVSKYLIDMKFNYCPGCGEKIDWEKINGNKQ